MLIIFLFPNLSHIKAMKPISAIMLSGSMGDIYLVSGTVENAAIKKALAKLAKLVLKQKTNISLLYFLKNNNIKDTNIKIPPIATL